MRRNLKAQILRNHKRVFLNPDDFGVLEHVVYWRYGQSKPPEDRNIVIVLDEDTNMNKTWNKHKDLQRIGHDQVMYQVEKVLFCALEDFNPPPKKGRRMQIGDRLYETLGVGNEYGMLKIELRALEE